MSVVDGMVTPNKDKFPGTFAHDLIRKKELFRCN